MVYGIRNTWLRRGVLIVAFVPLFLTTSIVNMLASLIEDIKEVPVSFGDCWRRE